MKIDNQDEYDLLYDFYIKQTLFTRLWVHKLNLFFINTKIYINYNRQELILKCCGISDGHWIIPNLVDLAVGGVPANPTIQVEMRLELLKDVYSYGKIF